MEYIEKVVKFLGICDFFQDMFILIWFFDCSRSFFCWRFNDVYDVYAVCVHVFNHFYIVYSFHFEVPFFSLKRSQLPAFLIESLSNDRFDFIYRLKNLKLTRTRGRKSAKENALPIFILNGTRGQQQTTFLGRKIKMTPKENMTFSTTWQYVSVSIIYMYMVDVYTWSCLF